MVDENEKFDRYRKYGFSEILDKWHHLDENRVIFKNLLNEYLEHNFIVNWIDWDRKETKVDYLLVGCYSQFYFENNQIFNKKYIKSKNDFGDYIWENYLKKYYLGLGKIPSKEDKYTNSSKIKSYVNATMILSGMINRKTNDYGIHPIEIVDKEVFKIVCDFHNNLYFDGKMIGDAYNECNKKLGEYWNDIKIKENDFNKKYIEYLEKELIKKENYENKKI